MEILIILVLISSFCAFVYEFCASKVISVSFRELTEEERVAAGISVEAAKELKVFESGKAGPYMYVMMLAYYPSYPLRKFINLFRF